MRHIICKQTGLQPLQDHWNPCPTRTSKALKFYIDTLKPLIVENSSQSLDGQHGIDTHTISVVFRGIDYALHMGYEPTPVVFACAFHDMARTHDDFDTEHGKHAIPKAIKIMKQFPGLLDQATCFSILYAIMNHTTGQIAPDYISACLWDADRTRLAWKYGFDKKFFNTGRGKYVAQHCKKYLAFQRTAFPRFNWSKQY